MRLELQKLRRTLGQIFSWATAVLGLVSGVASLGSWSKGASQIALRAVAGLCLLIVVVKIVDHVLFEQLRRLRKQNQALHEESRIKEADAARTLSRYRDGIMRVSDRQHPLYQEELELTVTVGENDDQDQIRERVTCTPKPQLVHKTTRLISPKGQNRIVRLDELNFTCEAEDARITVLPLIEAEDTVRVWLIFEESVTQPVTWTAEYSPKGLWAPLREQGHDELVWDDRLQTVGGASSMVNFAVNFIFPASDRPPRVTERVGLGKCSAPTRDVNGQWVIQWQDSQPNGRRYQWDLVVNK